MNFSLKVLETGKIEKDILKAMLRRLKTNFKFWAKGAQGTVGVAIMGALNNSPTVKSIEGGELREEFGITNPHIMHQIIMGIINSDTLTVKEPKIIGNQISCLIRLEAVPLDLSVFDDIGQQMTEKGRSLPWFQWLTTLGDAIIVRDFEVKAGFPKKSRTGDKIMVKGRGWRVPPSHAGSQENNFVTKAVDGIMGDIENIIISDFTNALMAGR
tara:strand:- start:881 stop:1519 length:639 start_codon:yes stop_codon:yes gene_type:complete